MRRTPYLLSVLSPALVAIVAVACPAQSPHWAYQPVQVRAVPATAKPAWVRSPLDAWVLAAMEQNGLSPAPRANRAAWLRRVTLDLTGVPPTPAEVAAFVADTDADAEARAVDALLASPRSAERWAQWWLDLARYADSQGYEKDDLRRTMWRYRDWVIDAFLRDLPFDEFTIEQLAGDLLPGATDEQRLATAFHRQTMTNTEGGTDDEEFRCAAVIDRVNTTMSRVDGDDDGCAQCHDHKYDPFSQREYFRAVRVLRPDRRSTTSRTTRRCCACPRLRQRAAQKVLELELAERCAASWQADDIAVDRLGGRARARCWRSVPRRRPVLCGTCSGRSRRRTSTPHTRRRSHRRPRVYASTRSSRGNAGATSPATWTARCTLWRGDRSAFYLHRTITLGDCGHGGAVARPRRRDQGVVERQRSARSRDRAARRRRSGTADRRTAARARTSCC
jgi:hypothetical protein